MKSTTLFSLFLLCGFTSYLPSGTAYLVDTDGNLIENGGSYFITTGNGGGVEFAATGNETCPLSVVQNISPFSSGLPVKLSTLRFIPYIAEGLNLDIGFPFISPCAPTPSWWEVVKGVKGGLSVKLSGYDNTVPGGFRIRSVRNDIVRGYNLLFCPEDTSCGYVGVDLDSKKNRSLVVTQDKKAAMSIQFQRVNLSPATATV
ncbi:trypsin inhibitor A-like [Vigna unguiculata]|uniref:Kunitz inhibitor ST1-like n=1 Tax=Vigna unguiculata TaxID=3917 RepID=A0A4D6NGA0_VIGUN|nr:trypsin inhibitor A-like [Vigna unguiculata]QCE11195.1 Kunitz inhibitor ST1-like [Vigna unguiculata]